ncbi:MAG: hypothetical protein WB952_08090 [Terriglobales bacterium]
MDVEIDYGEESEDPVAKVLAQLADADTDFDFESLRRQWRRHGTVSPKQMALIAWRLDVHGIDHEPTDFRVRTDRESDSAAIAEMPDWKLEQLLIYLTDEQKQSLGV